LGWYNVAVEDTLVIDIETKKLLRDIGHSGIEMPKLGISVVGVYSYVQDKFMAFREEEFDELEKLLSQAGQIVGFNLFAFDYPVMCGHLDFDFAKVKTVDILDDIRQAVGHRLSLNSVAKTTLGVQKSADGLQAVRFYQEGRWEELKKYCLDDVRITRDLFNFGRRHKFIKVAANYGLGTKNVLVNWSLMDGVFSSVSGSQKSFL